MGSIKFDISANNEDFIKKYKQIREAIMELSKTAELQSGRIDKVFNRISLSGLERISEIMQGFPKEIQGFESFKKQMSDLEKRLEQANKKIVELQNQAKQPIAVKTNTSEITKETFAYDSLLESLNDILGARGQNITAILQEQNAIRLNQKELKVLEGIEDRGLKLSETQQTRRVQLTNSIMQHKQAISSLRQVILNEIKIEESARGSMDEMSQSLGRMRMAYRQLSQQERNSKFGQELLKNIQTADSQIKHLDETIGNHQRNVGNYKSQWNGLNMSIQQVAREMPALAYGPKVFFSAISNNLPILADEIKRAKNEFKALKAEGKSATPVWKQVVSSLFSWQTALTIGITLLTVYGKEIVDWVGGLFKAKDAVKELLSAEQEMALARKKAASDSIKERTELDLLYKKLKDTTISTKERNAAINEWIKKYPRHSNIMNGELVSIGKLDSAYQSLSKQIIESAKARAYADKITELESKRFDVNFKRLNQKNTLEIAESEYLRTKEIYDKLQKDYDSGKSVGQALPSARVPYMNAKEEYEKQKRIYNDLEKETNDYASKINYIAEQIKVDDLYVQPNEGTYDYWQQQIQIADTALKQIDSKQKEILDNAAKDPKKNLYVLGIDKTIVDSYKKAVKDKTEAEKELKVYDSSSKQENAADKLRKQQESIREQQDKNAQLDKKQSLDRQRQQQDLENQAAQAEIDALDDSFEKIEKQRILNNKKEIQSLERQKEDFINAVIQFEKEKFDAKENLIAKQNPKHVKETFDPSTVKVNTSVFDGIIGNTSKEQLNDKVREQEDSWNEYLIKYGLFTQKKEAIDRKYKNLIEEASDAGKAATLQKEWDEALANLNLDKLKQDINWEVVFGDMSKVTKKQLQQVKKQLQEFKKSPEFKTSTPEQIKVIEEALNNINTALVDKGGFFGGLTDSLTEYEGTVYKVKEAQEELEKALKSGDEVAIEKAKKKKNAAEQNQANAQANVEKSKDKAIGNITAVSNAIVQLGKENVSLSDIGNTVGALVDTLSASGTKIGGIISAILSIIDAAGEVGTFQYGMDIIENISSTVTDAFARDTEAITGLDMSFMKSADYDDYNELVEEYGTLLDVWDQLLDKKKAYIKESYGAEVTKVGQEALDILNSEREITKELASSRLDAGKSAGSHSINYRMWKGSYDYNGINWKDVAGDISKALGGVDFSNMWSMLNISAEQLEWIKTNYTGLWANMDGDFRGYLDDIIKYGDTEKDIINSINEQLTQMSFDSLFDSFLNTLMDMDASSKDFADNFEEYMRKAIFTSMFAKNYEGALEDWYEAFAEANKKEGGITASDVKDLRNKWDDIVNGALSDREAWEQIVGSSGASTSQSSSQKGFAAMSQDTGEELNGRFTALQISNEEIKNSMLSMLVSMNLISVTVGNNSITLTEIRNLAISSNSYLEDIAGYQKRIVNEFGNKLDSINSGIKQFNSK